MNLGAVIADRYVLESPIDSGIPFTESWRSWDCRLDSPALMVLVTDGGGRDLPGSAMHVRAIRHSRLTRIVDVGLIECPEPDLADLPYIVFDEPKGIRVSDLLIRYRLPTPVARALVGEACASMEAAASLGFRHGAISPVMLTITDRGHVLVTGAGIADRLVHSDPSHGPVTDRDDARALALCFIRAVTGIEPDDVEPEDLPRDLTRTERDLSFAVLGPSGRPSFADLHRVFPSWNPSALRDLGMRQSSFPRLAPVEVITPEPEAVPALEGAPLLVEAPGAVRPFEPTEVVEEGLIDDGWGLTDFEEVALVEDTPTVAEAVFGFLHQRFPSWSLGQRLNERARDHTLAGPRFDATPWLLLVGFLVVVVVGVLSINWTTGPFTPTVDLNNLPSHEYPPYTFDPTDYPSPDS